MKRSDKHGFTLVEIMVVAAILAVLSIIGIPYVINGYQHSKVQIKARNIADVEKGKRVLILPKEEDITGAMGLSDPSLVIQDDPIALSNLCAALNLDALEALTVDGDPISVGTLNIKASY
jgi:prepilin-type N-terminal cleavage/methylation domain-containing protein